MLLHFTPLTIARIARPVAIAAVAQFLAACATYTPDPLPDMQAPIDRASVPSLVRAYPAGEAQGDIPINLTQPLTEDAIAALAVLANPDLEAQRARAGISDAQVYAAGLMPDPTISLGLDHILSGPDPVDALTGALGLDINALRTRAATRRKAQAEQHQARMDLVWAEWQTAGQARLQAVRIVSLEERAQLLSASHLSARSLFESYRAAAARGDVAADQLQTARLAEADAFQSEQLAEKDLAAARLELNRLLGLRPEAELRLAPLTMTDPSINAAKLFEIARAGRSDLRALREGYAAQEAALRKAVLDQFPTLDLTINGGRDTGKNITVGPAVGFTLPLWNRNRGGIAIEKATREALKSEYEARLFQTRADIASAVSGLNRARAQYRDQKAGLGSAQARAVSSRSAASRGDISRATAEVAEQTLRDRTAMVVQSAQDVAEQTIALELLTGVSREQWQ